MMGFVTNIYLALPEMVLLGIACLTLLADLFLKEKWPELPFYIAISGLSAIAVVSFLFFGNYSQSIFQGMYISDDLSQLMKLFISITVIFCLVYSRAYIAQWQIVSGEFYVLALLSTLGMFVLVSAGSLLSIYLGLELLSLPLYAMTAMSRSDGRASEAATKYFLMGAIASGLLLYGMSLIYGATGKLGLLDISNAIAANWQQQNGLLTFGLVFIVVGVGFKLAAAPFHMWAPDVYDGAPSAVTLFIASASKIAAVAMAIRVLTIGLIDLASSWQQMILILALLSTGLGNLIAVVQTNIKRLLAYSAISHSGYALFGLVAVTPQGFSAAVFYILIYALMSTAAFGLIVLLSRAGIEIQDVDDLKGLSRRSPWLAFMMMITLFSMAGVPPTVGFFSKLFVLKALIDVNLLWVAALGLIFAVIGAYYYLRIVKVMYFEEALSKDRIRLPISTTMIYSFNCLMLLYLGLFPTALVSACMSVFAN